MYTKFEEDDDKAMDWILDLEIEQEPYEKTVQEQVLEKSEGLNVLQKMQWLPPVRRTKPSVNLFPAA